MSNLSGIEVVTDRRTIRIRHDLWEWAGIDNPLWRESVARKFLATHSIEKEWEMTECYRDTRRCTIGIALVRREDT